jgi:hypothetical protein
MQDAINNNAFLFAFVRAAQVVLAAMDAIPGRSPPTPTLT